MDIWLVCCGRGVILTGNKVLSMSNGDTRGRDKKMTLPLLIYPKKIHLSPDLYDPSRTSNTLESDSERKDAWENGGSAPSNNRNKKDPSEYWGGHLTHYKRDAYL